MKSQPLPLVAILATGGTIAGSGASAGRPEYRAGALDIDQLTAAVPGLEDLARIKGEQISSVGSQDMSFEIMTRLARRINTLLAKAEITGVVVTHGTDTMEETAFFLNLTVNSRKPVVMTGAMRPATAISSDGPLNLYNAVAVAADPGAVDRGVVVVMNDRIHGAHSLTKTNTTSVETFLSPVQGLLGTVHFGSTAYFRAPARTHTADSEFAFDGTDDLPRVDIIYACVDMPPDHMDSAVACGARGIIIAGDGNGNISRAALAKAAELAGRGVIVVRSSRVPTGSVGRNIEVDDDAFGFIASDELNPAKARILLMLALLKNRSLEEIQSLFYRY